jgi:hypothetical protein
MQLIFFMVAATNNIQLSPRLAGVLVSFAGLLFVGISVITSLVTRDFISNAQRAEATVVSLYAGSSHPKLEFVRPDGEKVDFYGSGWISHRVGDRVPVLYLKDGAAKIDEPGSLWFLPGMFGALGGAALLVSVFMFLRR